MARCCNRHGNLAFCITLLPYPPDILHPALAPCGRFAGARQNAFQLAANQQRAASTRREGHIGRASWNSAC
jgi:hypothetical protein